MTKYDAIKLLEDMDNFEFLQLQDLIEENYAVDMTINDMIEILEGLDDRTDIDCDSTEGLAGFLISYK